MRRWSLVLLTLLLVTTGLLFAIFWLFGTTQGAYWMTDAVSRWTPVKIEAQKISGQIGHRLEIEGLRLYWPKGEVTIETFHLHWQPFHLLTGKVTIEDLTLQGIHIRDHRPELEASPDFEWPTAPALLLWIHGEIKNLRVEGLLYQRQNRNPLSTKRLTTRLNWSYGFLTLEKIDLEWPSGSVKGTAELGLMRPSLHLQLNISPAKAWGGIDSVNVSSRLLQAKGPEQVTGDVMIEGMYGSVKRFLVESDIGLTRNALHLRNFFLSRPGRHGTFSGEGQLFFSADDIVMNLAIRFSDLDLSQELGIRTAFLGTLHIEGNPNDYRGEMRIENTKGEWYSGHLSGTFKGGVQEAQITFLQGSLLDGSFQGTLNVGWGEGLALKGALQGRDLNPAIITPDWDGKINLDLEGTLRWPKENSPEGRLKAYLLRSHLRGQPLTGDMELHLERSVLRIARADLRGKGFDLLAQGVLQEKITFNADINDLSGLIPDTRGSFTARGWIVWRNRRLAVHLDGHGKELFVKGVALDAVDLSARLDETEEGPLEMRARFREMIYGSFRVHSAMLDVTGKLSGHKITLSAQRPEWHMESTIEGHYLNGEWRGIIAHLSGRDAVGNWTLQAPAEIDLSSRKIIVKSLKIDSTIGETLELGSDLSLHPLHGTLHAQWHQLNLTRINPWLKRPRFTGHTTGDFSIQWLDKDRLRLLGRLSLAGTYADGPMQIALSRGWVELDWNEEGLSAFWEFKDANQGKLWGNLSSPQPGQMAIPDHGRLEANWDAIDLSHLRPFLPRTLTLEGRLRGKLFGEWEDKMERFRTTGEVKVSQGRMYWQHGKEEIIRALQQVEASWMWRGDQLSGTLLLGLEDVGFLKTRFDLPLDAHWPISVRPRGPMRISLEGKFQEKGLAPTFFPDLIYESRGKIDLHVRADGTWEEPHLNAQLTLTKAEIQLFAGEMRSRAKGVLQSRRNLAAPRILKMNLDHGLVQFDWNEKRLEAVGEFDLATGGKIRAILSSPQPARMALPEQIKLDARWESIALTVFRPWLPHRLALDGRLSGRLSAQWLQGSRFDHVGEIKVSQGGVKWQNKESQIAADLQTLDINWTWQDETLKGHLSLAVADYAHLQGTFLLPMAPQWPVAMRHQGPLQLSVRGQLRERGLLTAILPDVIQESRGQMDLDLRVDGTWEKPHMQGVLRLKETGVYLLAGETGPQIAKSNVSESPLKLELSRGLIQLNWDEKGLLSSCHLELATGGQFQVNLSSSESAHMGLPGRGTVQGSWEMVGLGFFGPWLPSELALEGQLSGRLSGQWSNRRFNTAGEIKISQGKVRWKHKEGSVSTTLRSADLTWNWRDDYLRGELSLALANYGQAKGNFRLPLAARFPVAIHPTGPVELSLNGQLEEKGLLPAFFPGMVQESRGQIHVGLTGHGTWEKPKIEGILKLEKAGAYLPEAGIRLEEFSVEAQFQEEEIHITSFRTRSGPGQIEGDATIRIEKWKVSDYHGYLKGERFETVHLPELQILSSPRLEFHGTPQKLSVRGEIVLPEVLISGPPTKDMIRASPDVIIVDAPEVSKPTFPLSLDLEVRLLLGEKVYCKLGGLDVRLEGDLTVNVQGPDRMAVAGEIGVTQGHYDFYGHRLEILRGRLWFAGGSVDHPTVDALAVRKIGEVQAGVTVTGSLQKPIVKLYSRPAMAETDILAYIVLGQPLGKWTEQVPALAQAAGALLSAGESVILQGQLKKMFGLDTLDITTPPGGDEVSRSMVTIGKYLTPKLYISLGRSLFSEATLVTLRYTLSKRFEIETTTGTESAATLYYRIELN